MHNLIEFASPGAVFLKLVWNEWFIFQFNNKRNFLKNIVTQYSTTVFLRKNKIKDLLLPFITY